MPECILAIEAAFRDLGNEDAVDIPRQDAIVPNARAGAVHDLKTMSGSWPASGIAAIRLNSDIVTGPIVNGLPRRVKLHLSEPGGRYNGQVLLFSTDTGQLLAMVNDGMMQRARVGAPLRTDQGLQSDRGKPPAFRRALSQSARSGCARRGFAGRGSGRCRCAGHRYQFRQPDHQSAMAAARYAPLQCQPNRVGAAGVRKSHAAYR